MASNHPTTRLYHNPPFSFPSQPLMPSTFVHYDPAMAYGPPPVSVLTPHNPPAQTNATTSTTVPRKRVASQPSPATPVSKRTRVVNENTQTAAPPSASFPGAGPIDQRQTAGRPINRASSLPEKLVDGKSNASADDIWYFLVGIPAKDQTEATAARRSNPPILKTRPDSQMSPFIACRLCPDTHTSMWKNNNGGITATIRFHMQDKHWDSYSEIVMARKLKYHEDISRVWEESGGTPRKAQEAFTLNGFYERLIKWMTVTDKSVNEVESPELRELLLYLNADLKEEDLFHRTKVADLILTQFTREYEKMATEIQNSLGRVSFTSDIWSRRTLQPYMAITAHYMMPDTDPTKDHLIMKSSLIAFRHIKGSHSGQNLAKVFFDILEELKISHRIGMITLDNASNNNTFMAELERLLEQKRIVFHRNGNRIRCFPHIINLVVKAGLKHLTSIDLDSDPEVTREEISELFGDTFSSFVTATDPDYLRALQSDIVGLVRKLVTALRAFHSRREALRDIIEKGNKEGWFDEPLPVVTLLRDVDTRWSSIFLMVNRVCVFYPAIQIMLKQKEHEDLSHHLLTPIQLRVLDDIRAFLEIFHTTQQVVSGDKTPTLSVVIPIYDQLKEILEDAYCLYPNIKHAILASLNKLREYVDKAQVTPIYQLSMVLNPSIKFKHVEDNPQAFSELKATVITAMLEFQRSNTPTVQVGRRPIQVASSSAKALANGRKQLNTLAKTLSAKRRKVSTTPSSSQEGIINPPLQVQPGVVDLEEQHRDIVNKELNKWINDGVKPDEEDLVIFWRNHRRAYPLLYRLALDVLPVQASAVPCERVFSSSKETDSLRRANLEPRMMEAFQILKYLYRSERLDFLEGWIATEEECGTVLDVAPDVLDDLVIAGNIGQLEELIANSYSTS